MTIIHRIILSVAATAVVYGCGTGRQVATSTTQATANGTLSVAEAKAVMSRSVERQADAAWEKLKMPLTVDVTEPKDLSVNGQMEMERGKSILISLRYFGIEVGVMNVDADTIWVVDKLHKVYAAEPTVSFLAGFDVTVGNVQDFLLGRPFVVGANELTKKDVSRADIEVDTAGGGWLLIPQGKIEGVEYGFAFNAIGVLRSMIVKAADHDPVVCTYGDQQSAGAVAIASSVSIEARVGRNPVEAELRFNPSKARWNADADLRKFSVPKGYRRIPSEKVAEILANL